MTLGGDDGIKSLMRQAWQEIGAAYGSVGTLASQVSDRLVEVAALAPGMHILDIGCGTGLVLTRAAEAVGPRGRAIGVDFATAMVNESRRVVMESSLSNCQVLLMDATTLDFDGESFDACVAGSLIQFVLQSTEALAEWRRVLRPGGRLALSLPLVTESDSLATFNDAVRKVLPEPFRSAGSGVPPAPDLAKLALRAGFAAATQTDDAFIDVLADFETWWSFHWTHATRSLLARLSQEVLAELKAELFDALGCPQAEVELQMSMRFCVATL